MTKDVILFFAITFSVASLFAKDKADANVLGLAGAIYVVGFFVLKRQEELKDEILSELRKGQS